MTGGKSGGENQKAQLDSATPSMADCAVPDNLNVLVMHL